MSPALVFVTLFKKYKKKKLLPFVTFLAFQNDVGDRGNYETNLKQMQKSWENFRADSKKKG